MTLARVFCGIAAAEVAPWLTVAVVDDAGRLLDLRHLSDDPAGYAQLSGLLADRSNGATPVALDRGDHLIAQLLAAGRQPLVVADEMATADFAERFSDDTSYDDNRAPLDQRCAVGLARALQAGALHAMIQSAAIDLDELKPVLGAHAAIAAGRQAAATALREVLRELYPAALRAFPDPAEFIPLKILDALPEPSLLSASPSSRQRDASLVAELASTGVADAQTAMSAISALRASVEESPRWASNRTITPVVGETVRQAVAAVRAADAASAALVSALVERLGQLRSADGRAAPPRPYLVASAPVSPAPRRVPGPAAAVPPSRLAPRASAASAAAAGVPSPAGIATAPGFAASIPSPRAAPGSDGYGTEPVPGPNSYPGSDADTYPGGTGSFPPVRSPAHAAEAPVYRPPVPPVHEQPVHEPPTRPPSFDEMVTTLSFSPDPLTAPLRPDSPGRPPQDTYQAGHAAPPPGQWHDPRFPVQPPSARPADPARPDPLTDPLPARSSAAVHDAAQSNGTAVANDADDNLLIFAQTQSAWFTFVDEEDVSEPQDWSLPADEGWRAAEHLANPTVGAATSAGLPRRVPQANLVPGSAQSARRQLRIVRDAQSIAEHTEGYFRGWRRGQEIGGYAVGQRDRAAWEFNRDQRARLP